MNTPKHRQEWIYEQLETSPGLTHGECFANYSLKYARTKKTFDGDWKKARHRHSELSALKEQAINDTIVGEAVKAAQNGLKSKYERMASLEAHIQRMEDELNEGTVTDTRFDKSTNRPVQYVRRMRTNEITMIRKTLRDYHVELSKMQGDYAAEKIDFDGDFGTVLVLPANGRNE